MKAYLSRAGTMIIALVFSLLVLASVRTLLELAHPTYSGFGPWRPFLETFYIFIILSGVLLVVEGVATLFNWVNDISQKELLMTGAFCALPASLPITKYFYFEITLSELWIFIFSIITIIFLRIYLGRRNVRA
jgi:hypothetical protein